jgi:hypothetical protein
MPEQLQKEVATMFLGGKYDQKIAEASSVDFHT